MAGESVEKIRGITNPPMTTYTFYKILKLAGIQIRGHISKRKTVPENTLLVCGCCEKSKPAKEFSKHKSTILGYDTSRCKSCKKSKVDWGRVSIESKILHRAKSRAKSKSIDFDLTVADIILPLRCPVFDVEFQYGHTDWTYSIDRIDPKLGYVRGNTQIISNKANRLKNNASLEDIGKLYKWMLSNQKPLWELTWRDIDEINQIHCGMVSALSEHEEQPEST